MEIIFKLDPAEYAEASDILADLVQRVQTKEPKEEPAPAAKVEPSAPAAPAPAVQSAPAPATPAPAAQTAPAPAAPAQAPVQTVMPTSKPAFTREQLALAATQLMDAGKQADLVKVLQDMGVPSLANLDPSRYSDFAARIRSLGAKI